MDELHSSLPVVVKDKKPVISHPHMNKITFPYEGGDTFGFIQFTRDASGEISSLKIGAENIEFIKVNRSVLTEH